MRTWPLPIPSSRWCCTSNRRWQRRMVEGNADLLPTGQEAEAADMTGISWRMLLVLMSLLWIAARARGSTPPLPAQASCKSIVFDPGSSSACLGGEAPSVDA